MSAFNNTTAAGTYTLQVTDTEFGTVGFLRDWSMTVIRDTASTRTSGSNGRILLDANNRSGNVISDIGSTLTATGPANTNPYTGAVTPYLPNLFVGGTETYGFVDGISSTADLRTLFDYDLNTAAKDPASAPNGEEPVLALFRLDSGFGELQSGIASTAFSGFDMLVAVNLTELNLGSPELGVYSGSSGSATTRLGFDGVTSAAHQNVTALNANTVWATLIPESTSSIDFSIAGGLGFDDLAIADGDVHYLTQSRPVPGNLGPAGATAAVSGVRNLTQSVDGNQVYALTETRDALVVVDSTTRTATQVFEEGVNGIQTLNSTTGITPAVDGRHVYVTGSGGSMGIFHRDTESGALTFGRIQNLDPSDTAAPTIERLVFHPASDTGFAHFNNGGTHTVGAFSRDSNSGLLTSTGATLSLGTDVVDVSLNGDRLYVLRANVLESYSAEAGAALFSQLQTVNVSGQRIVGTNNHVHVLDATNDAVRSFTVDSAGDLAPLQTVANFANGVSSMDGPIDLIESTDGSLAYVVAKDSNAISVIKLDGSGEQVQRLRNNSGGLVGFVAPNSSQSGPNDSVWVATTGNLANTGGITTFDLVNGLPDPQTVEAVFGGIENVTVATAGGADTLNLLQSLASEVSTLTVNAGSNTDEITIDQHSPTTTVNLGAGNDTASLQTSSDGNITINGDAGDDEFDLIRVGTSTTTELNGGDNADLFRVDGQQVPSTATTTINGDDPTTMPGDTLRYAPGTGTVTRNGTPSNGNISVTGQGQIDYTTLESVDEDAAPIITPVAIPASINEGQALALTVSVNPRGTGNQLAGLQWTINGTDVTTTSATTLSVPWNDLRFEYGVGDGPASFNVTVKATNADQVSSTRVFAITLNNVAPTIAITANSAANVGQPFAFQADHSDPGDDSPIRWIVDWGDLTPSTSFGALTSIPATHTYDEPGQYTVTVSVIDEDSTPNVAASTTHVVTVTASAADISAGGPYTINEGDGLTLSAAAIGNWQSVNWDLNGDANFTDASGLNPTLSAAQLAALGLNDDSNQLVRVRVAYANGDTVDASTTLEILNVDPTAVFSNDAPSTGVDEGTAGNVVEVTFNNSLDASPADLLTYAFDFDNDGTFEITGQGTASAFVPAAFLGDSGLVTVRGRISDDDGGFNDVLTSFRVNEVLPSFQLQGTNTAVEGSDYELTIADLLDPGINDVMTSLDIDWGDGSAIESVTPANGTVMHRFADDSATTTIRVTATGPDGSTTVTKDVIVTNAPPQWSNPTVVNDAGGTTILEGDFARLTADLFDPGILDTFNLTIDWGDGDSATFDNLAAGTSNISATHAYANDGVYTITLSATDDDGATATTTVDATVLNAAPELALALDQTVIDETGSVLLSGIVTDAGLADAHSVQIDWADGSATETVAVVDGQFSATHIYADDNPSATSSDVYAIQVTAIDDADNFSTVGSSIDVTVNNLDPFLLSATNTASRFTDAVGPGDSVTASAEFDEPSAADTFTVTVNWGDGTVDTNPTVVFDATNGIYRVNAQHAYAADGRYPVTISVQDDDTGLATATVDAIITSPGANDVPVVNDQTFNVAENSVSGTGVGTVVATDANIPQGDVLIYSIVPGSLNRIDANTGDAETFSANVFTIDSTTGELTLSNPLLFDREATERYTIQVAVEDAFTATSTATVSVVLTDVNEFGPAAEPGSFTLSETAAADGLVLGQLVATDADAGDTLTFTADPGPFAVSASGEVTVADASQLDFDNNVRYTLTFTVTDQGGETAESLFTVDLNAAPRLAAIGDQVIEEGDQLAFTAVGNDPGLIDNEIQYSLDAGAPAGSSIDANTGLFTWTPTEAQGPAAYSVTVRVTDNGTPAQSTAETITITVGEVNVAPLLAPIGDQTVAEEAELTFTAAATDIDLPVNNLTFSLDPGAPAGATIDPNTGVFSWTPTEAQGPATYTLTIRVTDDATTPLSDFETITVTVGEVNNAPVLAPIGDKFVNEDNLLTFTASATDVDLPANTLTFSLDPGAPAASAIDPQTGVFTWTPTEAQGPDFVDITIRVTDDGSPALDDFETITVQVGNFAPEIFVDKTTVTFDEGQLATNSGTFFDQDNDAVVLSASIGQITDNLDGTWSWSFDTNDGPAQSQVVTVTATDSDNDSTSATFQLNIENVAPVVQLNAVTAIVENGIATLTGTVADPGTQDTFTLSVNWGDPLSPNNVETYSFPASASGTQDFTLTHRYLDDNVSGTPSDTYTISVEATDSDTGTGTASQTVSVNNVAPTLQLNAVDAIVENGIATLTGTITDPGTQDTFALEINWGDPRSPDNFETYTFAASSSGTQSFTLTHQYLDDDADDQYTISVVLTDDDTATDSDSVPVTVTNVDPSIDTILAKNPDGTLLNGVSIGGINSSFSTDNLFANSEFQITPALTQTGQNNQPFDVFAGISDWTATGRSGSIEVHDGDHGTGVASGNQVVELARYQAISQTIIVDESGRFDFSLDVAKRNSWSTKNGIRILLDGEEFTRIHPATNSLETYSYTLDLFAGQHTFEFEGLSWSTSRGSVIDNISLTQNDTLDALNLDLCVHSDGDVELTGTFSDISPIDTHQVTVDWGDGTSETINEFSDLNRDFLGNHTYAAGGVYEITVTLTDDDGGIDVETALVSIRGTSVVDGTLYVIGTDGNDYISIRESGNNLRIYENLAGQSPRWITVPTDDVHSIMIGSCQGNDYVSLKRPSHIPAQIQAPGGRNTIYADDGHEIITTGDGNDTIRVADGLFTIDAGDGRNVIDGFDGDGTVIAGAGHDTVRLRHGNHTIDVSSGGSRIVVSGDGNNMITATDGYDSVSTRDGEHVISVGDGGSYIRTRDGNSRITSEVGYDRIYAGHGDLIVSGGNGRKVIYAGNGFQTITTGDGNDYIRLGNGGFAIDSGDGNNQIFAGHGGGELTTGNGYDRVQVRSGDHTIDVGDGGSNIRTVGDGDNTITAGAGPDIVSTRNGNQTISTGDGNDRVYTGQGNDIILTGAGNDYVSASHGNDIISTGSGNDVAYGGRGNDVVIGGDGRDKLRGGSGNDLIISDSTDNENEIVSLELALNEWTTSADANTAVSHLGTIHEDNDRDTLFGESGIDELFGGLGDILFQ